MKKPLIKVRHVEVKPFIVTTKPIIGESLRGFVTRALSLTPLRNVRDALDLAGIDLTSAKDIDRLAEVPVALERLGSLLGVSADRLIALHQRRRTTSVYSLLQINGAAFPPQYFDRPHRKVSARGLKKSAHHRQIWEIGLFSFDPETLEEFTLNCPVCQEPLGWSHAVCPFHCDRCLDDDGSYVDLRDFERPTVEVEDPAALQFICDLVSVDREVRLKAQRSAPPEWSNVPAGQLFELAIHLLRWETFEHKSRFLRVVSPRDFRMFTAVSLAAAGRTILSGVAALRSAALHQSDRSHVGSFIWALERDHYVTAGVLSLVSQALSDRTHSPSHSVYEIAERDRLPVGRLQLLGALGFARTDYRVGEAMRIYEHEMENLLYYIDDAVTLEQMATKLGLSHDDIYKLAEVGAIRPIAGRALLLLGGREYFSSESAEALFPLTQRLNDLKLQPEYEELHLRQFGDVALIVKLLDLERNYDRRPMSATWAERLSIHDPSVFVAELSAIASNLWVPKTTVLRDEAAAILEISQALLDRLIDANHLCTVEHDRGQIYLSAIHDLRSTAVFEQELRARYAVDVRNRVRPTIEKLGVSVLAGLGNGDVVVDRYELLAAEMKVAGAVDC